MNNIKKICVAGGGNLGSQIAFQAAYKGFEVKIWSRRPESLEKTKKRLDDLKETYHKTLDIMATPHGKDRSIFSKGLYNDDPSTYTKEESEKLKSQTDKGYEEIKHELDLGEAVKDADLVIEAVIENKQIKSDFYKSISKLLPEKTIIVSNSSSLVPHLFAEDTGRPDKFFCLHFANRIWFKNSAEIMPHDKTNPIYMDVVEKFVREIGMEPIRVLKEIRGYLLNSLLFPFLRAALTLWVNGAADYKDIDKVWTINTGYPEGPFHRLDNIGLNTVYNIFAANPEFKDTNSTTYKIGMKLKERIDKGLIGRESGEGFYKYNEEDFLFTKNVSNK